MDFRRSEGSEEEEAEDVCRICRASNEELFYPCACNGSIKFVHQDCLLQWLRHSHGQQCEVCKHAFTFLPVYAEDSPTRLSYSEFILGLAVRVGQALKVFGRLALVVLFWRIIGPYMAFGTWRLMFSRSISEASSILFGWFNLVSLLADACYGTLLSACMFLFFDYASALRDFLQESGLNVEREDDILVNRQPEARAEGRQRQGPHRLEGGSQAGPQGPGFAAGAGQLILRNVENVAAHVEMQAARHIEEMLDAIDAAYVVHFDAFIGMHDNFLQVMDDLYALLWGNAYFLALTIFIPFTLGRGALYIILIWQPVLKDLSRKVENSLGITFWNATTVAAGYIIIFSAVCLHFSLRALINYSKGEPVITDRLRHVALLVARAAPSIAKYTKTMLKVVLVLSVGLGGLPLLCGFWLDICSLRILGGTLAKRMSFFWAAPLTSCLLHWVVGTVYILHTSSFVGILKKLLRSEVLYFIWDPADPNYDPVKDLLENPIQEHVRRFFLSIVVGGSLIVLLVYLPVQLALFAAPSLFPLKIRLSDSLVALPVELFLFHIWVPSTIKHLRPKAALKTVLRHWFSVVSRALGLLEFLFPREDNVNQAGEAIREGHAQVQPLVVGIDGFQHKPHVFPKVHDFDKYIFAIKIFLLLIGAWITIVLFNTAMLLLPISLGRRILSAMAYFPISKPVRYNDLQAFCVGCHIIWAVVAGIGYGIDRFKQHNIRFLVMQLMSWTPLVAKIFVPSLLWFVVIPSLIGLLFDLLVVIPLCVPIDKSPLFLLYQDWALGLAILKIWTRLVLLGQVAPLIDGYWRMKLERLKRAGFAHLQGLWIMREIVLPILVQLLTALCVPYVFARGLFPALGYSPIVNSVVYRFAWLGCLLLKLVWHGGKHMPQCILKLHNTIRDDRYLVGKRLLNLQR